MISQLLFSTISNADSVSKGLCRVLSCPALPEICGLDDEDKFFRETFEPQVVAVSFRRFVAVWWRRHG